jgi:L-alanine-DL-glutamate epimerase-like enolase superfamily enzyme
MGFIGAKVPLPYGPGDGDKGMRGNIDYIKLARESVGLDFPLMIDCYVCFTLSSPRFLLLDELHSELHGRTMPKNRS